jgi:hypothetical protein
MQQALSKAPILVSLVVTNATLFSKVVIYNIRYTTPFSRLVSIDLPTQKRAASHKLHVANAMHTDPCIAPRLARHSPHGLGLLGAQAPRRVHPNLELCFTFSLDSYCILLRWLRVCLRSFWSVETISSRLS